MEPDNWHKQGPGELVLQNGRQAGARRPLGAVTTFIGRAPNCDVRLNVDGVEPLHCLLVVGAGAVHLRDLNSAKGTFVNGDRVENAPLRNGDLLKVGPFQFRVELATVPESIVDHTPLEESREALRIQAAAVAAQQVALEEEEARLQQRRHDLQQQEEQLAAHLDEKQRQVQLWSDFTQSERENWRKEKLEQEKILAQLEADLQQAQQDLARDHQKLTKERQHIQLVHQRLRKRWQQNWSAEKEKYQKQAKKLQADTLALEDRQRALAEREAAFHQVVVQFNTERELSTRELRDGRSTLAKDQETWRRRRSHEFTVLKGMQRQADETQLRIQQARQVLLEEKAAWDKQVGDLHKELVGLNSRIVNQRARVLEQQEEIVRLDAVLRERHAQVGKLPPPASGADVEHAPELLPECEVEICVETSAPLALEPEVWRGRLEHLDLLASELADQRIHLIEQYELLAAIQQTWQQQQAQAAAEMEAIAARLIGSEQALVQRDQQIVASELSLEARQREAESLRADMQAWQAQLAARELAVEQEHARQLQQLGQSRALLQEQLAGIAGLRQRWNLRRQQEVEKLQARQAVLDEQQAETHERRQALFEKGQQIEAEKRILSEKALALEQYRQEVFFRANDPASQRRVERQRRRWLSLNATMIRNCKTERDAARKALQQLEGQRIELDQALKRLTENELALAEKQAWLDEQEAALTARQALVAQELGKIEFQRQKAESQHLRMQEAIDTLAKSVYEESNQAA